MHRETSKLRNSSELPQKFLEIFGNSRIIFGNSGTQQEKNLTPLAKKKLQVCKWNNNYYWLVCLFLSGYFIKLIHSLRKQTYIQLSRLAHPWMFFFLLFRSPTFSSFGDPKGLLCGHCVNKQFSNYDFTGILSIINLIFILKVLKSSVQKHLIAFDIDI